MENFRSLKASILAMGTVYTTLRMLAPFGALSLFVYHFSVLAYFNPNMDNFSLLGILLPLLVLFWAIH